MIFLLEDDLERIAWFESLFGDQLVVTRTVEAALYSFEGRSDFEIVFLDHDLDESSVRGEYVEKHHSGCAFVNSVLCQEVRYPGLRKAQRIIVHSMNPDGALAMCLAMKASGLVPEAIPFNDLKKRMTVQ